MQTNKNTSISVSVSSETADCVKTILESSGFVSKINQEGLIIDDTSTFVRLAIVNLLTTDVKIIKKSIVHSSSDAKLLKFLKVQVGGKNE